jgi:polyhydroxyalkanoate synthesis regulator phasin
VTSEEREALMVDRIETIRARTMDELERVQQLERRVEKLEAEVMRLYSQLTRLARNEVKT